jgi:aminomethyltransferase
MNHQSPLFDEHRSLGAAFTDFAGWQMPLKYRSELDEHRAVRTAAGLFDLSHMGEIEVTGPQAAAALDYALVGDPSKVTAGRAKYSLLCTADGGVLDDLVVYRHGEHDFMIVVNAANACLVHTEIAKRAAIFDADVIDHSASTALIALQGPAAAAILTTQLDDTGTALLGELKYYASTPATVAGVDVLLARTGYPGEDGFELYVDNPDAPRLWRVLVEATRAAGGVPAGLACRDTLRLEAGMALYGHELTPTTNPYEAGLGSTIALTKTFVGSQALQELSHQQPARRLVGLTGEGRRAARGGYAVLHNGSTVGTVTSGALSPTLGHPIALAYIPTELSEPGTRIAVDVRGRELPFTVTARPFYKRPRS